MKNGDFPSSRLRQSWSKSPRVPVGDVRRQVELTLFRWKKAYGVMLPSEVCELKRRREENMQRKRPSRFAQHQHGIARTVAGSI